eukprot:1133533-Pelagomonas_calceolata.AAC.1
MVMACPPDLKLLFKVGAHMGGVEGKERLDSAPAQEHKCSYALAWHVQADSSTPLDFPETDDEDEPVGLIDWVSGGGDTVW